LSQYQQLGDSGEVMVDGGSIMANGVLAEITRARQIANGVVKKNGDKVTFTGESCKLDRLMANLDARGILGGESDTKVLVSSRYNEFITSALIPRLEKAGAKYHVLMGKTSERERDRIMAEFQAEGGPQVFILNSKAGGISITLDSADEVHCLDELDNPEENEQLEDRAHRASRIHQVTIYYYRTEGTYDVNVAKNVEDKRQAQFEVLDGRRGIEDVRQWIKYDPEES
jgi:SNF2 family DNA or RNA helicase